jgi:beta-barrel assembly-enhancing protease
MPSNPQDPALDGGAHYGRYSDGASARAEDATVTFAADGLDFLLKSTGEHRLWRYQVLKAGEPLRPRSIDVLLSATTHAGATLFVPGSEFATELAKRAPHLGARAERWRHARPWLIGTFAVGLLIAVSSALGFSPAHALANVLPQSWRDKLGQEAVRSMTEGHKRCTDKAGLAAVDMLTKRLATGADRPEPFKVVVADWSLMNAFAVPGSTIVMTRGLIEHAESPDEVAAVLAHEMGHGIELHPETGIIRAVGMAAALEFMMGGSGGTLANLGLALAQLSYTRVAEHEADLQAITLLRRSSISPKGFGDFFKRVAKLESEDKVGSAIKDFNLLRTHPPTAERAELVAKQPAYAATPALDDESWQALKRVCAATAPEVVD